jgi:hypothetical protein
MILFWYTFGKYVNLIRSTMLPPSSSKSKSSSGGTYSGIAYPINFSSGASSVISNGIAFPSPPIMPLLSPENLESLSSASSEIQLTGIREN